MIKKIAINFEFANSCAFIVKKKILPKKRKVTCKSFAKYFLLDKSICFADKNMFCCVESSFFFFQTLDPRLILWLTCCLFYPTPSPTPVDLTPMCAVSLIFIRRNVIMAKRAFAVKKSTRVMWRQSKLHFIHFIVFLIYSLHRDKDKYVIYVYHVYR